MMPTSSSQKPGEDMSLTSRLKTILRKAHELSTLCGVEVSVVYYGPDGKEKTWPEQRDKVKDMALRYNAATKRKKSLTLQAFLEENKFKKKKMKQTKKRRELENVNGIKCPTWYPNFDHYSDHQLSELILSLQQTFTILQESLLVIEAQKQSNTNFLVDHYSLNQTKPSLNPNQFSLYMYNHQDDTLSKLLLPNQDLYDDLGHNVTDSNFEQSCFSDTQDGSTLLSEQETAVNNYLSKNQLVQPHELYGFEFMSMMMSDITDSQNYW